MDFRLVALGVLLLAAVQFTHASQLTGTCSVTSTQCDLSVSKLSLCNDTQATQEYSTHFNSSQPDWFNVIPDSLSLPPGECTQLNVYTVANCYAEPGRYNAQLVVDSSEGEQLSAMCNLSLQQGHFISLQVQPSQQNATQCEEKDYRIAVTNNTIVQNQNTENANLTVTGLDPSWYSLDQEQLQVQKGNTASTTLRVKAPCDAQFGSYAFTVKGTLPNPDFYSQDSGNYTIGQGQSTGIGLGQQVQVGNLNACMETPSDTTVTIVNSGKLQDNYKLALDGPGFASLDKDTVSLDPGQQATVKVRFAPTPESAGQYRLKLTAESLVFGYTTEKEFTVNLQKCYGLRVEQSQGGTSLCQQGNQSYVFSITNDKSMPVDANISIRGIGATLDKEHVHIEPGQSQQVSAALDTSGLAKPASTTQASLAIELLVDTSGSMVEKAGEQSKIDIAKEAMINLVNSINPVDFGLREFGQGRACEPSEQLSSVSGMDTARLKQAITSMEPSGMTPLAQALSSSIGDFNAEKGKEKAVILVSDGKETCGGDPGKAAQSLRASGITVYAIGFSIDANGRNQLAGIASTTGGEYFDANDTASLAQVFESISTELKIMPGKAATKTFTLDVKAPYFTFEKDYTITVNDCYNSRVSTQNLSLCPTVQKSATFTLADLGSKAQDYTLTYNPAWVTGPGSAILNPGDKKVFRLTATAPDTTAREYTVTASSDNGAVSQASSISYLPEAACFGVDIVLPVPELDAATCQGQKQQLMVMNSGATGQEVSIRADKPYVTIVEPSVYAEPGQKVPVDYFVSPPFDLPATTGIGFVASTDHGFETAAELKLVVHGNQESYGPGSVDVNLLDVNAQQAKGLNYNVAVTFDIYNDSNKTLEVSKALVLDYNGFVQLEKSYVEPHGRISARAFVELPADTNSGNAVVPVSLSTDQGTYTRTIEFKYNQNSAGKQETQAGSSVSVGTGLFTLPKLSTAVLGLLIVAVIALIVYSAYKSTGENGGHHGNAAAVPNTQATTQPQATTQGKSQKGKAPGAPRQKPVSVKQGRGKK